MEQIVNKTTLTSEDIMNVACAAFEGGRFGIAYWCNEIRVTKEATEPRPEKEYWTKSLWAVGHDGEVKLREFDETTGKLVKWHTLTSKKLAKGIALAAEKFGKSVRVFVDNCDGPDADEAIQFAVFGKAIYG